MTLEVQSQRVSPTATNHTLPDTGEKIPMVSWPTVALFAAAVTVFGVSTEAALTSALRPILTIPVSAAAIFVLFTVVHDASHYSISRHRWVNLVFGRVAMIFVSPLISFESFAFIHIEHHRHTNDGDDDPDHFVSGAAGWQLPLRFSVMDLPYLRFLARNWGSRPRSELAETAALMGVTLAAIAAAAFTGHFWQLAIVYLVPERIAVFVLAWWFDWLPHHDLKDTHQGNRYRATRNRVGAEWILTPLLLSQNYHLVHHLHPSIPFYKYVAAWRRNEAAYLDRDPALMTAFGQQLDAAEYRRWKRLNGRLAALVPIHSPRPVAERSGVAHPAVIRSVESLTPDSVKITFDISPDLREHFRFQPGQHLTVHHRVGQQDVRRSYSICTSAVSDELAIAIRRVPGGTFSTFATAKLRAGDKVRLGPPTGNFGVPFVSSARRTYVAVAAGSGITPILSVVRTGLDVEPQSRFTILYGNRTTASTMFRKELDDMEKQFGDRLSVVHVRSRDGGQSAGTRGRISYSLVQQVVGCESGDVDRWFLCGPQELVTTLRDNLIDAGVDSERVHLELFRTHAAATPPPGSIASDMTVTLRGADHDIHLHAGETILEAALRNKLDAPYACMGGACGTCTAVITSGQMSMDQNFALRDDDVRAGRVLTCQARPTSRSIKIDYDAR